VWENFKGQRVFDRFTDHEAAFIGARDTSSTVSETGWLYVQHRDRPPGFLKVLDQTTLGFADFRGNGSISAWAILPPTTALRSSSWITPIVRA